MFYFFISFKLSERPGVSFPLGWQEAQSSRGLPALQWVKGGRLLQSTRQVPSITVG